MIGSHKACLTNNGHNEPFPICGNDSDVRRSKDDGKMRMTWIGEATYWICRHWSISVLWDWRHQNSQSMLQTRGWPQRSRDWGLEDMAIERGSLGDGNIPSYRQACWEERVPRMNSECTGSCRKTDMQACIIYFRFHDLQLWLLWSGSASAPKRWAFFWVVDDEWWRNWISVTEWKAVGNECPLMHVMFWCRWSLHLARSSREAQIPGMEWPLLCPRV